MNSFVLRFAVAVLAPLAILHPATARCEAVAAPLPADSRFTMLVEGKGPDVILIPGLASPRDVWDGTRAALAGKYRLHIVQIKGFDGGDPGPNVAGPIIDPAVEQIDAYIVANKLKSPAVIGHSMGGLMALLLAKRHAADVGKVMIVDSLPWVGVIFAPNATVAQMEPTAKAIAAKMAASYGQPADMAAQTANAQRLALKPDSVAKVAAWGAKADPRVVGQAFYEDMTIDLRDQMGSITTPITLTYPFSAALPQAVADPLYRGSYAPAPHVTYVPIGDAAHFIMLDQPAAFEAAVAAFLAGK